MTYLRAERGRIAAVARRAGIAPAFLAQIANRSRPTPPVHVPVLEKATDFNVRRWDWCPNDWHRIWPELIGADGAPDVPETTTQPGALDEAVGA